MKPPPPPPPAAYNFGTPEWGRYVISLMAPMDAAVVNALVQIGLGLDPPPPPGRDAFASLSRVRMAYASQCYERGWDGPTARLVWGVLDAIIKVAEDDIPF